MTKFWVWHERGPATKIEADSREGAVEKYVTTYGATCEVFVVPLAEVDGFTAEFTLTRTTTAF